MSREQEHRHIYYDYDLKLEAYNLSGIAQKFPNHFHEYYVIGFVYGGNRHLWCKDQEYDLKSGDLIIFNPRDNHYCSPISGEILDYRAINVASSVMLKAATEITGKKSMPYFSQNVMYQSDVSILIGNLYNSILSQDSKLKKKKAFYFLLKRLLEENLIIFKNPEISAATEIINNLCNYMDVNFADNITLDDLLTLTDFGKSYLLRLFTKHVGVSPYRYLQTIRIDKAKKFLEQGIPPIDTAAMSGFSDQSHFTNYFKEFIGLTPKQYQNIFTDK